MNIDLVREIHDSKLLRDWNGEEPKYPLRKKVEPDEEEGDRGNYEPDLLDAFVKHQKRLPLAMEKLLHDNAWELYEK